MFYFQMGKETKRLEIVSILTKGVYLKSFFSHVEQLLVQKYGPPVLKDTQKAKLLNGSSINNKWIFPKTVIHLAYTEIGTMNFIVLRYMTSELDKRI